MIEKEFGEISKPRYIDDSGTNLGDKKFEYFVMGAFAIHSDHGHLIEERLNAFKMQLVTWAAPEDLELKGRWLQHGDQLFKKLNLDWPAKVKAFHDVTQIIDEIPCRVFVVLLHKPSLVESLDSDEDLYRLAFWRLLDELDEELKRENQAGLLMLDGQSDLHSHISDRRFIDSYRRWASSRVKEPNFVELPWFGFSAFYSGLQLADFTAYLTWLISEESRTGRRAEDLHKAFAKIEHKVQRVFIP